MQFDEVLRIWKEFFEREGIACAVIGGLAMRVWGRARLTNDLDIAVIRSAIPRVVAHAESLGTMSSNERVEAMPPIDFERALAMSAEDNAALWRAHEASYQMDPHEYLAFLLAFTDQHPPDREIPPFHEPFEL